MLISEPLLPRNQWRFGWVIQAIHDVDGLVRKACVRISAGTLMRPVVKLCLLEGDLDNAPTARDLGSEVT